MMDIIDQMRGHQFPLGFFKALSPEHESHLSHPENEVKPPQYYLNGLKARST